MRLFAVLYEAHPLAGPANLATCPGFLALSDLHLGHSITPPKILL